MLEGNLIGSYVFGSAVTGDFEPGVSDVDTVAVLSSDPGVEQLTDLAAMHHDLIGAMPEWDDRVEAVYVSADALASFRSGPRPAARVSPGEPFHGIDVDARWLIDWYRLREVGRALIGPPPSTLVPTIDLDEYVRAVRAHVLSFDPDDDFLRRGDQSSVILTLCRGLRTVETGEQVSKRAAAAWAIRRLPEHADLIREALAWRVEAASGRNTEDPQGRVATARFVRATRLLVGDN